MLQGDAHGMRLMAAVTTDASLSFSGNTNPPRPILPVSPHIAEGIAIPSAAVQVQGLEALGFPRDACVEALMACTFQLSQLEPSPSAPWRGK